jgi:hypothetical protein
VFRSKSQFRVRSRLASSRTKGIGKTDHSQLTCHTHITADHPAKRLVSAMQRSPASKPLRKNMEASCPTAIARTT